MHLISRNSLFINHWIHIERRLVEIMLIVYLKNLKRLYRKEHQKYKFKALIRKIVFVDL